MLLLLLFNTTRTTSVRLLLLLLNTTRTRSGLRRLPTYLKRIKNMTFRHPINELTDTVWSKPAN